MLVTAPKPPKHYLVETNCSGRTTSQNCNHLEGQGYETIRLPRQPTAIIVVDHARRPWRRNRIALAGLANSPRASIVVMSAQTGNVLQFDRRGNRPNRWVRRHPTKP
jgi:hypothetical protein